MRLRAVRAGSGSASHARECCERCGRLRQARERPTLEPGHDALNELPCYRALIDRHRSPSIAIDRLDNYKAVNERRGNHCKTADVLKKKR